MDHLIAQDQGQTRTKASHPDACYYITYHLSIMHVFTSEVLPKLDYQNYF